MRAEWMWKAANSRFAWLNEHATGWQFGEQGVLWAICQAGCVPERAAYEIGAGDGESLPLTIEPQYDAQYRTVLYEIDNDRQAKLKAKFPLARVRGKFIDTVIGMHDSLVIIDVDSYDVRIMQSILNSHIYPSVMMVEHYDKCGPYCGDKEPGWQSVPDWLLGMQIQQGGFIIQAPSARLNTIAGLFEYTMIGTSRVNSIFVHYQYLHKLDK